MVDARDRAQWNYLAHVLAWIQNSVASEGNLVSPSEVNPYTREKTDGESNSRGLTITPMVLGVMVKVLKNSKKR